MPRRINVKIDDDLYFELIRRYGIRRLSVVVNEALRRYLTKTEKESGEKEGKEVGNPKPCL